MIQREKMRKENEKRKRKVKKGMNDTREERWGGKRGKGKRKRRK